MTDIFREIDEELRRENFAKLWEKHGKYLVALVVLVVLITAGVVGWREYQARQRQAEGVRYASAFDLARQGKDAEAANAFAAATRDFDTSRAMLARFEEAGLRAKQGDAKGATALYDQLAADGSLSSSYRDLAALLAARYGLDGDDAKAVVARLKPLTDAANPWHPTALELTALADLKLGDKAAAHDAYQHIADDLDAPEALRARATEMVGVLAP